MPVLNPPIVLLPDAALLPQWPVVACDQFTSQPEYWEGLRAQIGGAPSTLDLILPEAFLHNPGTLDAATESIAAAMARLRGVLQEVSGYVLVERTLSSTVRLGLLTALDLGAYDYSDHTTAPVRATERTVAERLPARITIRQAGPLELSHVMVLIDDPSAQVIENLYKRRDTFKLLYDVELMADGGHLRGWLVPGSESVAVTEQLAGLERDGVLAIVGDGNHSLAAAKLCRDTSATVELVNIHSPAIEFEPIHRVVTGPKAALDELVEQLASMNGPAAVSTWHAGVTAAVQVAANPADAIADLQNLVDDFAAARDGVAMDYVHGDTALLEVAEREAGLAIFMPTIAKESLFDYVARRGVLPRKAFSIGHAEDKRYYLELAERR